MDDIEPSLCTHIIYADGFLNRSSRKFEISCSLPDVADEFLLKIPEFKKKGVKVCMVFIAH